MYGSRCSFIKSSGTRTGEVFDMDLKKLEQAARLIIEAVGDDPDREGLRETPKRFADMMAEQFAYTAVSNEDIAREFEKTFATPENDMVVVKDIELYSLCEHHMVPFFGKAHVAYIPNGYITGLSKIARVVDIFSHRLQVQERLTQQIKDCIQETLKPQGVMVVIEAKHMCMQMRGVEKQNSITTTSDFSGAFQQAKTREEFMNLLRGESRRI